MRILGVESSCDETAAAVLENGSSILSSVVASQDDVHARFGGVVPEVASRKHLQSILPVIERALEQSDSSMEDIEGIACTRGPGLIGSLLVGLSTAKAIAFARGIPFIGVHHIEGHLAAALLGPEQPSFPLVGLVASGGHTNLFRMDGPGQFRLLAQSRDDAAGEAFDKVAKICGLPYPGGPALDLASEGGDPTAIDLPRPAKTMSDFSFSGLKTAVALWIKKNGVPEGKALADLAASFQEAVLDSLIPRLFAAADAERVPGVVVCGGVAKNRRFRSRLESETQARGLTLHLAPLSLCTDNAAMIAAAGYSRLVSGASDPWSLNAVATMPLATP